MPSADIDGIATHYEVLGDGPPLLMYSPGGFDASLDKWSNLGVYERRSCSNICPERFRCIVFDRRETGSSGGRVEHVGWDDYVEQGFGLLDHLGHREGSPDGRLYGLLSRHSVCGAIPRARQQHGALLAGRRRPFSHPRRRAVRPASGGGRQRGSRWGREAGAWHGRGLRQGPEGRAVGSGHSQRRRICRRVSTIDVDRYKLIMTGIARTLIDRDTAPGAEPEDLLQLDIPALIVPGKGCCTRHIGSPLSRRMPALQRVPGFAARCADQRQHAGDDWRLSATRRNRRLMRACRGRSGLQ